MVTKPGGVMELSSGVDVALEDLGVLGPELGRGGRGVVYDAPALGLPDVDGELVYKSYREPENLGDDLVSVRSALDAGTRARLDGLTTWPVRRVVDHGRVVGVVLPKIPGSFVRTAVGRATGTVFTGPRDAQGLIVEPSRSEDALGEPAPGHATRLRICRDLASVLVLLHDETDVVYGDLGPRNVLVRFHEQPTVLLVDCDSARLRTSPLTPAIETPDWEAPEGGPSTRETDSYKLGLFILRTLAPAAMASVNRDPGWAANALDADGFDLLRRSLHPSPAQRPTVLEWFVHLSHVLGEVVRPPELRSAGLSVSLVAPGDSTCVRWELDQPGEVTIVSHGVVLASLRAPAGAGSTDITPVTSGVVRVEVRNAVGGDARPAGGVMVLSDPVTVDLPVPMPVPPLPAAWPEPPVPPTPLPPRAGLDPVMSPPFPVTSRTWPHTADPVGPAPAGRRPVRPTHVVSPPPPWWVTLPDLPLLETGPSARSEAAR